MEFKKRRYNHIVDKAYFPVLISGALFCIFGVQSVLTGLVAESVVHSRDEKELYVLRKLD